ncbi:MAG: leucyl aminopeptidase, partial [Sphingomonadales bacterium]
MKISFSESLQIETGALALFAVDGPKLGAGGADFDKTTDGALTKAFKASRFSGKPGQVVSILAPANLGFSRIVVIGLGDPGEVTTLSAENAGATLAATLLRSGEEKVSILAESLSELSLTGSDFGCHVAIGLKLRSYHFSKYLTKQPETSKVSLEDAVIVSSASGIEKAYTEAGQVLEGVFLTRDLISEPANVIYPASFAAKIKELEKDGVEVEILGEKQLKKIGMGSLLAVGQGSARESHVAIMKWNGGKKGDAPLGLIGKGVTFDTGGISLKPGAGMEEMKWDMGGAGIVTGTLKALARRKARVNVVGIVGLVENMPSSNAQRPGDVVKSLSGQTIEVLNTDAEGRMVLADILWYCQDRFKPKAMIDLATLTGAIIVTLGRGQFAGIFTDNDEVAKGLESAGKKSGDQVWRLPLNDEYDKWINCDIADMKNMGDGPNAGSITAAQFLKRFTNGVPWAHIDVAGMVWTLKPGRLWDKGATGYGV